MTRSGSRNLESKLGAEEVLVVGSGGIEKNYRPYALPTLQMQRDELESGWSPEPVEVQATEVRPQRLEGLLVAKDELKSIGRW